MGLEDFKLCCGGWGEMKWSLLVFSPTLLAACLLGNHALTHSRFDVLIFGVNGSAYFYSYMYKNGFFSSVGGWHARDRDGGILERSM